MEEFVERLADGWVSEVGEGGLKLSGGQVAGSPSRAIVGNRPLLLLDEPTAGLDRWAKRQVINAVRSAAHGRTVIIVTRDQELAEVAQRVVTLRLEGAIHECSSTLSSTAPEPTAKPEERPL